jgi:endonuclease-3
VPTRPAARTAAPSPSKSAADTRRILAKLATQHPNADTELNFRTPYELLVATILSAQCTDERVNQVTPALFARYPDARALARATTAELEPQIQSTGFFRAKSKALTGMAAAVVDRHGGEIPKTMEELVELPGVGRKTANVVLGHALGVPGLPVDRHVLRVANRIGIARSDDPVIVEQQLCGALPPADWTRASDTLILHGRRICKPRPLCDRCAVRDDCDYYRAAMGVVPAVRRSAKLPKSAPEPRAARTPKSLQQAGRAPKRQGGAAASPGSLPQAGSGAKPRERAAADPGSPPQARRPAKRQDRTAASPGSLPQAAARLRRAAKAKQ